MMYRMIVTAGMFTLLAAAALPAQTPAKSNGMTTKSTTAPAKPHPATASHTASPVKPVVASKLTLKEAQPGLIAMATVPVADALKTATAEYSGKVTSERIERRKDELVYVFGIRGAKGVRHVMVDAKTGKIVQAQAEAKHMMHKQTSKPKT